jgi:hypothetical protein
MTRKVFSATFLLIGVLIGLGAYGHGFVGRGTIDAELDKFQIGRDVYTMLYVVWYFVSGCMALFGLTILWAWARLRRGDPSLLFVAYLIGVLYLASGVGGMIYMQGDPFGIMTLFILEGALLLISTFVLSRTTPPSVVAA